MSRFLIFMDYEKQILENRSKNIITYYYVFTVYLSLITSENVRSQIFFEKNLCNRMVLYMFV